MDIEAFRASHAAFPLDANSRALLDHLASFGDQEFDWMIAHDDIAIHIYRRPAGDPIGFAFILEGPRGFQYYWGQGSRPSASLSEAENDLFAEYIAEGA